ncbi:diguanylate cyclase (GGDEF)-like protein [Paucimonas lemoignei]|uniref:diguanylate cyclase n=1 Tax=Paucimonas lemoignei TaxID=29443 RepID=A0A4R3HVF6_PAULE|nr:diguanylate cyclase (GGDEF)-like protein [Paucimonas lemoignei]
MIRKIVNIVFCLPCFFVIALLFSIGAQASSAPVVLDADTGRYAVSSQLEYVEDASGKLTFEEIRAAAGTRGFQPVNASTPSFGFTSSSMWFRFTIENRSARFKDWLLEVLYPPLDHVDIYLVAPDGSHAVMRGGDRRPFDARAIKERNINFLLEVQPGDSRDVYVNVRTNSSMQLPLVLWNMPTYIEAKEHEQHLMGLFYGILAGLFVFNLVLFLSTRDKPYLYYVSYLLAFFLFQATLHGLTYEYLWPDAPAWANTALPIFLCMGSIGVTEFTRSFLDIGKNFPRLNHFFTAFLLISVATAAAAFFAPYPLVIRLGTLEGVIASVMAFATGCYALAKGVKPARYFMIAWSVFLIGSLLYALKTFGLLPSVFITNYGQQIGSALEVILLSMALADRLRILKEENERIQRQATTELETRVQERTRELDAALQKLADANKALHELNLVDPLTGIKNRKFFNERYAEEWRRAMRQQYPIALIMVDIDHFKSINDRYGHLCGDVCIKAVANVLQGSLRRPSDHAARYGGEEFCLIIPHGDAAGVAALAEEVRSRVQERVVEFDDKRLHLTVSVGIGIMVPMPDDNSDTLIARADAALYEAKKLGRNQVRMDTHCQMDQDAASPESAGVTAV